MGAGERKLGLAHNLAGLIYGWRGIFGGTTENTESTEERKGKLNLEHLLPDQAISPAPGSANCDCHVLFVCSWLDELPRQQCWGGG
jgi:hypothetical protein